MHTERSHLTAWKDDFDGNPLSTQLVAKHLNFKEDILQGEFQPLLISIFAHFTCQELAWGTACCIRYMSLTHYKMNDNLWQSRNGSVTHRRTKTAPCSRALKWKIKFRTVTVFQKCFLTLLCYREDNYNSNSSLPLSALLYRATAGPAHPGRSLDCRQHSILWMPASSPSVRSIGTGG